MRNGNLYLTNKNVLDNQSVLGFLLENGADPNIPDLYDNYPLENAIKFNSYAATHILIQSNKIDFNKKITLKENSNLMFDFTDLPPNTIKEDSDDFKYTTYLLLAVESNEINILLDLINQKEVNINATDYLGNTPLINACKAQNLTNIQVLFQRDDLDYLHCNKKGEDAFKVLSKEMFFEEEVKAGKDEKPISKDEYLKKILKTKLELDAPGFNFNFGNTSVFNSYEANTTGFNFSFGSSEHPNQINTNKAKESDNNSLNTTGFNFSSTEQQGTNTLNETGKNFFGATGFNFGDFSTSTESESKAFSFSEPSNQNSFSFNFGDSKQPTSEASNNSPKSTGFNFGDLSTSTESGSKAFSFSEPSNQNSFSFNFGDSKQPTSEASNNSPKSTGFNFGDLSTSTESGSKAFSFSEPSNQNSFSFNFGDSKPSPNIEENITPSDVGFNSFNLKLDAPAGAFGNSSFSFSTTDQPSQEGSSRGECSSAVSSCGPSLCSTPQKGSANMCICSNSGIFISCGESEVAKPTRQLSICKSSSMFVSGSQREAHKSSRPLKIVSQGSVFISPEKPLAESMGRCKSSERVAQACGGFECRGRNLHGVAPRRRTSRRLAGASDWEDRGCLSAESEIAQQQLMRMVERDYSRQIQFKQLLSSQAALMQNLQKKPKRSKKNHK